MGQKAIKGDGISDPSQWIRTQQARLAESGAVELAKVASAEQRKLVRAFAPISRYLDEVAKAGVTLKSYGAGHKLEYAEMHRPGPNATEYEVRFQALIEADATAPEEAYSVEEWGFGIRAAKEDGRVGFENYDFNRKGRIGGKIAPLEPSPAAALATFMERIEAHMVRIDAPGI